MICIQCGEAEPREDLAELEDGGWIHYEHLPRTAAEIAVYLQELRAIRPDGASLAAARERLSAWCAERGLTSQVTVGTAGCVLVVYRPVPGDVLEVARVEFPRLDAAGFGAAVARVMATPGIPGRTSPAPPSGLAP